MSRQVVHAYGFTDKPFPVAVGLCPGETVQEAFERIRSNVEHFGGSVVNFRRTTPLGESRISAVEVQFEAPAHDQTAGMWHVITVARKDEWKAKP